MGKSTGLFLTALALWTVSATGASAKTAVDLELVLAVDISGSVDHEEARLQRSGYVAAMRDREVIKAVTSGTLGRIAVAYVEWADASQQALVVDWTLIASKKDSLAFAAALDAAPISRGRFTAIGAAIDFALPIVEANEFEGTRRVIDVSGDGANNSGGFVHFARDRAVARGITINGLPIVNDRPQWFGPQLPDLDLYYENCVIGGSGAFYIIADDFQSFGVAIRRKLILEIAGHQPPRPQRAGQAAAVADPVIRVADRVAPDCDVGERMLQMRQRSWDGGNN